MEKQKLGSTPNEAPTLKKAYLEPTLSLISFAPEQGFATSVAGDASHYDTPVEGDAKDNLYYTVDSGVWD